MSKTQVGGLMEMKIWGDCFQPVGITSGKVCFSLLCPALTLGGKRLLHSQWANAPFTPALTHICFLLSLPSPQGCSPVA